MSAIPPGWLGSIIQSSGAQQRATERRGAESAADSERAPAETIAGDQIVIENGDRDGSVYSDAEGMGSQGRPTDDAPEDAPADAATNEPRRGGLDIEA